MQALFGWRHLSIGAVGDINPVRSFTAATLNLHVGRVR